MSAADDAWRARRRTRKLREIAYALSNYRFPGLDVQPEDLTRLAHAIGEGMTEIAALLEGNVT